MKTHNPMQMKTPAERKAIAAKSHATRRRKLDEAAAAKRTALAYRDKISFQIKELEEKLSRLQQAEAGSCVAVKLTGKALLQEAQIAKAALSWKKPSGVYFLLRDEVVVYVGQSVNVFYRIAQHIDKDFDSWAYVPCAPDALNKLESLYIHVLRPPLNATKPDGEMIAPVSFDALLCLAGA